MFSNTITKNKMAVSVPCITHETVSLGIELRNFVLTKNSLYWYSTNMIVCSTQNSVPNLNYSFQIATFGKF